MGWLRDLFLGKGFKPELEDQTINVPFGIGENGQLKVASFLKSQVDTAGITAQDLKLAEMYAMEAVIAQQWGLSIADSIRKKATMTTLPAPVEVMIKDIEGPFKDAFDKCCSWALEQMGHKPDSGPDPSLN